MCWSVVMNLFCFVFCRWFVLVWRRVVEVWAAHSFMSVIVTVSCRRLLSCHVGGAESLCKCTPGSCAAHQPQVQGVCSSERRKCASTAEWENPWKSFQTSGVSMCLSVSVCDFVLCCSVCPCVCDCDLDFILFCGRRRHCGENAWSDPGGPGMDGL